MRLLRLSLTGIGPFAGTEIIDFSRFEAAGLFLLEGPTGAGKSTIIDALTFALYGDVARQKDASKDRLRSNLIDDQAPSEVDLVFEVGSGIYCVTRTPSFQPQGRKTVRNSQATLVKVAEDPASPVGFTTTHALASGPSKVGPEIQNLVGLDKEQFLQTIVLPQGKFSQFLTATSDQREKILRDIFETHDFVRFQEALLTQAGRSRQVIDRAAESARAAFDQLMDSPVPQLSDQPNESADNDGATAKFDLGEAPAAFDPTDENPSDALGSARERVDAVASAHGLATDELDALRNTLAAAQSAHALAVQTAADIEERAQAVKRLEELNERREEFSDLSARVVLAQEARELHAFIRHDQQAQEALESAQASVAQACQSTADEAGLWDGGVSVPQSVDEGEALSGRAENQRSGVEAARARLEDLVALEAGLAQRRRDLDAARVEIDSLTSRIAASTESIQTLNEQVQAGERGLAAMRTDVAELPAIRQQLDNLNLRIDASERADMLRAGLEASAQEIREAKIHARVMNAAAQDAHDLWLRSTAAFLSAELQDDHPCPVCGSFEHPLPAQADGDSISREEVKARDEARDQAENQLIQAEATHRQRVRDIASLNEVAKADTASLLIEKAELSRTVEALEEVAAQIPPLSEAIEQETARLSHDRQAVGEDEQKLAALQAAYDKDLSSIEKDEESCVQARGTHESLAQVDELYANRLERLTALISAVTRWKGASQAAQSARDSRDQALAESTFDSGDSGARDVEKALVPQDQVAHMRQEISDYEHERRSLEQALVSERLTRVDGASVPDLEALQGGVEAATDAHDQALHRVGALEQALAALSSYHETFLRALDELRRVRQEAGPVRRLADLAGARTPDNLVQIPLSAWVLVSRLDEVLERANPRLLAISSGRYELRAVADDGTQSRRSGLGLAVLDHDSDQLRSTRTLSGGETFYTSLCLALGLADVVTDEAGGVELRTMFIDEGFGSLDAHTLELVMQQLHNLRDSGRTVGVISHVEEMAHQIGDQINVRPRPHAGSTLSIRSV
ncbi:AAA family ATPase [Schaalia vaccimaxillae]|uniref:AAA family ATPase n=1 Tax=Schaalia vaccimaxillae TaxID=183916 RepID=UPI0003B66120|nr:SMC family ATPase [Schaalia vaccimaxillae]